MLLRSSWYCTNLVLIRHGESFNNSIYEVVREKFGDTLTDEQVEVEIDKLHDPDCGLSARGLKQAHALKEYLAAGKFTLAKDIDEWKIYSSPMKRCVLTAEQVSEGFGKKPVLVRPNLFESDGCYKPNGDGTTSGLPGMTAKDIETMIPHFKCEAGMENGWYKLPRKETRAEFYERCDKVVEMLWEEHFTALRTGNQPTHNIILVAHGNLIGETISKLLNTKAMITNCNTGICHVQLWSDVVTGQQRVSSLQFTNRIEHLIPHPQLIAGNEIFEDHWIQEYFAKE